ncbi:MAG TPA: hypothetical protein VFX59_13290 [Polyangiales bacterium]|nr:hypothetical protein [Polyangiales bacterium]
MARAGEEAKVVTAIERLGALLVYPIASRPEIPSIWSVLYPRSEMHWAWDADADPRVSSVWILREQIARGRRVVYSKWFRGRAVFFSHALFGSMLSTRRPWQAERSREASEILQVLEDDSPQSSKDLRRHAGLRGKESERVWTRATKELWEQLAIVGTGEVPDGAFPSLEIGATRWIFEELWEEAQRREPDRELLDAQLPAASAFGKFWRQSLR